MSEHQFLDHRSSDRETEHVHMLISERRYERCSVVRHSLDRIGCLSARTADALVVERDDRPAFGQPVEQLRVPIVHRGAKVREQDKRHPALITEPAIGVARSEEHTSELQSLMRISYAVFCLKKKKN